MISTMPKTMNLSIKFLLTLVCVYLALTIPVSAQLFPQSDKVRFHGQIRTGYYYIESRNNAGQTTDVSEWRLRARFGITYRMTERLSFTARLAGRYSTEQEEFKLWLHPYGASRSGLQLGQTSFDMFHFQWADGNRVMVQVGRMQHSFYLKGIVGKGLDRYHSSNVSITWADGVWVRYLIHPDWYIHAIAQYNHRKGTTSNFASPLQFTESASRFTWFAAIEGSETSGLWNQRELSLTLMPSTYRDADDNIQSYWALTGRLGINLPVDFSFMDIMVAGEAGYAPTAPALSQFNVSSESGANDDAFAWQVSINFQNIFRQHNLGILYGETDPGWLIAPSFRNNTNTIEVRHQFRFNRSLSTEIRYRIRNQLHTPIDAAVKRKDDDLYARITYRF
jgi:hypothetical protein